MKHETDGKTKLLSDWSNRINQQAFYEHSSSERALKSYAQLGGLDSGCDVDVIYSQIVNTKHLLEIGSGYGRVIQKLLNLGYKGKIHSIELSQLFCEKLAALFPGRVEINNTSILDFESSLKFDAILSMWSGISDFTRNEQFLFVQKLAYLVTSDGLIILDTSIWNQKPLNAVGLQSQNYIIQEEDCILRGYIPSYSEIHEYTEAAGLKIIDHFEYTTDKERKRLFYVLRLLP